MPCLSPRRVLGPSLLLCAIGLLNSSPAAPQPESNLPPTPAFNAARLETPDIQIDGVLDEPAWQNATRVTEFWEFTPGENVVPPVETEMLVVFDERNLYVAARAFDDDPEKIRAHLMDRDAINTMVQDDYILIMLDTFNDHRRAFQFRINPLGVQADALNGYVNGFEDWSWDMLWDSAGQITDDGYVIEVRLPFNQLPFPEVSAAEAEQATASTREPTETSAVKVPGVWRIRLGRSWPRDQRHRWSSGPTDFADACGTCRFNEFAGFVDLSPGKAFEIVPTLTAGRTDRRNDFPSGSLENGDEDADLGVSGQWSINQSTRLSFAVNPDFSQVEADAAQLAVNERFALFFPEQRPFFLEGIDIFQTPLQAVFTRTVADPDWGLKFTTKQGNNTLGVFASQDSVNNVILPGNQGSRFASSADGLLEGDVLGSVVRYRRDIGQRNSIGVLYAGREDGDYSNQVIGVDGSIRLAAADTLTFQGLHSQTDYPEELASAFSLGGTDFGGNAFRLSYGHRERGWNWGAHFDRIDKGFRADSGFIPRVDLQALTASVERLIYPKDHWATLFGIGVNASRSEDTEGALTDSKIGVTAFVNGPMQSTLWGQTWVIDKRDGPLLFEDLTGAEAYFEIQPTGQLRLELYAALEDEVDFANNREADLMVVSPEIELKIGRRIQTSLDFGRRTFRNETGTYLRADLAEWRFFYHFSTRSFIRAIVQRTAQSNDPSQFIFPVERETEDLFTQLLFSYKLNAQTVLFAGYSDNRVGNETLSLTQTDRSVFFKIGYAFVL